MRVPKQLMKHKFDHYKPTFTIVNGEQIATYAITHKDIPCNSQDATVEIVDLYKQRKERIKAVIYLVDYEVFQDIAVEDKITSNNKSFRVIGTVNLCNFNQVFRLDLEEVL